MDEWVKDIVDKFVADTDYEPRFSESSVRLMKNTLVPGESILIEIRQSYLRDISPDSIFITNKRIIILRPSFWGLYFGHDIATPTSISIVPYKNIITVVMLRGKILSTINMRITGFMSSSGHISGGQEYEGEMDGIRTKDAMLFVSFIERLIERRDEEEKTDSHKKNLETTSETGTTLIHNHAGRISLEEARKLVMEKGSKFVWLGLEPEEEIANLIGVDKSNVVSIDLGKIRSMDRDQISKMENYVFISYGNVLPNHTAKYIEKNYGIKTYILENGVLEVMSKKLDNLT